VQAESTSGEASAFGDVFVVDDTDPQDELFDPADDAGLGAPRGLSPDQSQPGERGARRRRVARPQKKLAPLAPNGFQRFVQASTGQLVPLFGVKAFEQGFDLTPPATSSVPAAYTIGPGDELLVQITGIEDAQLRLVVDRQGRVSLPKVGTVSVVGLAAKDLEPFLDRQLRKSFKNFTLSASLGAVRPIDVYVVGQARSPGRHTISAMSSFLSAVLATGGPNATGSLRHVELVRDGATIASLDVYAFVTAGKTVGDVRLLPGDTIVFRAAGPRIALLGDVNEPAVYELRSADETLAELLTLVGGLPVTASRSRALLERIDPAARAPRSVEAIALDDAGQKTSLRDGDVLTVLPISQLGVMELTRQRVRQSLKHSVSTVCPACGGSGVRKSINVMALDFVRRLRALLGERSGDLVARLHPDVALPLANAKRAAVAATRAWRATSLKS
jgi:protein involved in polysaccharide export with SLBB domain